MANNITKPATVFRAGISLASQNDTPVVSYEGGNFEAGFIQNFAVITSGEALGHGSWVDADFVADVAMQLASSKKGVVSRYTHPNMSGDALSKGLGRVVYRADGDGKVRGDLHFYKAAHKSPDGNLAEYLMDLATDDPESFGASISFERDIEAEESYAEANPSSNDPRNVDNLPHVRLGKLRFVDIVSQPAANPDGLFCADDTFKQAEALMGFMLGMTTEKPDTSEIFSVDADRLAQFTQRYLTTNGLKIMNEVELNEVEEVVEVVEAVEAPEVAEVAVEEVEVVETPCCEAEPCECEEAPVEEAPVEEAPVEEAPEVEEVEEEVNPMDGPRAVSPQFSKEDLAKYIESFGQDAGLGFFMNDIEFNDAQGQYIAAQNEKIASLKSQIELGEETEDQPLSGNNGEAVETKGQGFKVVIK